MPLPIAVEITPPDAPREHVTLLLAACARASASAECVPAAEAPAHGTSAVAIVTWSGERRVTIDVGLRTGGKPAWVSRTLDFRTSDEQAERWRTIGFVVGTLSRGDGSAGRETSGAPAENPATEPGSKTADAAKRGRSPKSPQPARGERGEFNLVEGESSSRSWRPRTFGVPGFALDVGASLGPALDGLRRGGLVRGGIRVAAPLRTMFAVRYHDRPMGDGSYGGRWITGAVGLGLDLLDKPLSLTISLDARAEYFQARARLGDEQRSRSVILPGAGLGVNAGWMPAESFGFFLGVDAALMTKNKAIEVEESKVATDSAFQINFEGGVRFGLW